MVRIRKELKKHSKVAHPLDSVNLHRSDREIAQAQMEKAEVFADLVFRAGSGLRSMVEAFGHGCSVLAHRARTAFGKLAHH